MNPKKPKIKYSQNKKTINPKHILYKYKEKRQYKNFKPNKFINIDFETFKRTKRFSHGIAKKENKHFFSNKDCTRILDLKIGDVVYVWNLGFVTIDKFLNVEIESAQVSNRNKRKLKWYVSDIKFIPKEIQLLDTTYANNKISVFAIDFSDTRNTYESLILSHKADLLGQCCYQETIREGDFAKETYLCYLILTMPKEEVYQKNSLAYKEEFIDFFEKSYKSQTFMTFPMKYQKCYCSFGEKIERFKR